MSELENAGATLCCKAENDFQVTGAEFVFQQRVAVKPIARHYEKPGEAPYIKWGCPICDGLVSKYAHYEEVFTKFSPFSFAEGTSNCPVCGINLEWDDSESVNN